MDDETLPATATGPAHGTEPPPVLSRGRHRAAESGVCLMELTALLAGEDLTDRPSGVHPLVAAVARVVNDSVSDGVRDDLLSRCALFRGTTSDDAEIADRMTLTVIDAALPVALPIWAPRLRRERRRILHRLDRPRGPITPRRMGSQVRTVTFAVGSLALAPTEHPDTTLIRLLDDVLAVVRPDASAGSATGAGRHADRPLVQHSPSGRSEGRPLRPRPVSS